MRSPAPSTRAPRRSSGWYSPGCWGYEPSGQARRPQRGNQKESVMAYLLQRLLAEAAARLPQRPAIASDGVQLTYQELDVLSNKVARALLRMVVAPKSAAAVIGIYGALKAGACYVPLDPKAPAGRLSHIVRDSGTAVIITDEARAPQAAAVVGNVPRPRGVVVASF